MSDEKEDGNEEAEIEIYRVEWIPDPGVPYGRVVLNGNPVGPSVHQQFADAVVQWFTGYLKSQAEAFIEETGLASEDTQVTAVREPQEGSDDDDEREA